MPFTEVKIKPVSKGEKITNLFASIENLKLYRIARTFEGYALQRLAIQDYGSKKGQLAWEYQASFKSLRKARKAYKLVTLDVVEDY